MNLSVLCGRAGAPLDLSVVVVFISRPCFHVMALQDSEPQRCPSLVDLVTGDPIISHLWEQHQSYFYQVYKYIRACIGQGEMWDEIRCAFLCTRLALGHSGISPP